MEPGFKAPNLEQAGERTCSCWWYSPETDTFRQKSMAPNTKQKYPEEEKNFWKLETQKEKKKIMEIEGGEGKYNMSVRERERERREALWPCFLSADKAKEKNEA